MHELRSILLFFILLSFSLLTKASTIEVSPTKIFISSNKKFTAINVKNLSQEKVFIQAELLNWSQKQNDNIYTPSNELIVNPLIFAVDANSEQIIRIGLKKNYSNIKEEQSFRLLLSELPDQFKIASGLKMLLRLNLPIFIEPSEKTNQELVWSKKIVNSDTVNLTISNPNNTHRMINKIELKDKLNKSLYDKQNAFIYLLPHQEYTWTIKNNKKLVKYLDTIDKSNNNNLAMSVNTTFGVENVIAMNNTNNINEKTPTAKESTTTIALQESKNAPLGDKKDS